LGFVPLHDITKRRPITRKQVNRPPCRENFRSHVRISILVQGLPSLRLRPQAFSTSRRFSPPLGFWACFIPSRVQGSTCSGASLSVQLLPLIEKALPPCRRRNDCSPTEADSTFIPPRLRGFDPHEAALPQFGVNRPTARSPRQVLVSSRCSPAHLALWFPRTIRS
jgi:hypothetical protein